MNLEQFGWRQAAKAWVAALALLVASAGYEVGAEWLDPDSGTINALLVVVAPVVAYVATWLAPRNQQ